jgi:DNA transformation protein and related proteins
MAVGGEFRELVSELLSPVGPIGMRNMFGGTGIYCRGIMFGLIMDDALYFKVDDADRDTYAAAGCQPFTYEGRNGKRVALSYYGVPAWLLDERDEIAAWAGRALAAAERGRPAAPRRRVAAGRR